MQSLAGIVGGEATGCDAGTTNVFIECALFDRVRIAQSGQRHGIFSDARQRFERGIDSQLLPAALDAATSMVLSLCGGTASEVSEAGARPDWTREASLRFARIKAFGGSEIGADEAVARTAASRLRRAGARCAAGACQRAELAQRHRPAPGAGPGERGQRRHGRRGRATNRARGGSARGSAAA